MYLLFLCIICNIIRWYINLPWTKTGPTYYLIQLRLPDNGLAVTGLLNCKRGDVSALGPTLRSGPTLLSTVPRGINQRVNPAPILRTIKTKNNIFTLIKNI